MKTYIDYLPRIKNLESNLLGGSVQASQELDLNKYALNDLKLFVKRPVKRFILPHAYLGRFDLVSYDIYGVVDYWWVICVNNNITDIWDDSLVGEIIECPDILDINDYIMSIRYRR